MRARMWIGAVAAAGTMAAATACASSSTSSASGEESKTADQIYSDAIRAFDGQAGVHLTTTAQDNSGAIKEDALITADAGRATITDPSGAVTVLVVTGGAAYASQGGSGFQQLSGDLLTQVSSITVHRTASCARTDHGTLTKGPVSTLNGKRVISIVDDGKAPGASPGTMYVALDGTPLPVRAAQTGPSSAGGSLQCGHSPQSTTTSQTIDFDYLSGSVTISPPVT